MKKFLSNIIAICAGVFDFLGLITPAIGLYVNAGILGGENTTWVSGYDFISFENGAPTSEIMFSVFAIIMMVVAALLVIVSVVRLFADNKKYKLDMIQNILSCILAVFAIATLICAIAFVSDYNSATIHIGEEKIGIGSILNCIVLVVCAVFVFLFNRKKK